jgi:hypothetical protein
VRDIEILMVKILMNIQNANFLLKIRFQTQSQKKMSCFSIFKIHSTKPTTQTTLMNFEVKHLKSQNNLFKIYPKALNFEHLELKII